MSDEDQSREQPSALVLRLLGEDDKAASLLDSIQKAQRGKPDPRRFVIDTADFRTIPNTPFSYWVTDQVRGLFEKLDSLEGDNRKAAVGLQTSDDNRFVRQCWEVDADKLKERDHWFPYAKGGSYVPFYRDVHTVVAWSNRGREISAYVNAKYEYYKGNAHKMLHVDEDHYLRPVLTWVRRTKRLCVRPFPRGGIFSDRAQAVLTSPERLLCTLGLLNSTLADSLIKLSVGRTGSGVEFQSGMLSNLPWPEIPPDAASELEDVALRGWRLQRRLDTVAQTSHALVLPALLQVEGSSLALRAKEWEARVTEVEEQLSEVHDQIDEVAYELYGLGSEDRAALLQGVAGSGPVDADREEDDEPEEHDADEPALASALVSWLVGVAFGRFDVRIATGEVSAPDSQEPFDSLPPCAPGILVGPNSLPATSDCIASAAFLNERPDAASYPEPASHDEPTITAASYPLRVGWDGILVDDPGLEGESAADADILRRTREAMQLIWGDRARDIEEELVRMLGNSDLRDYIARHTQFFHDDLRRYTRTRKAPIYWSLSTESGDYTVWIYYPRLSEDTLYRVVSQHVEPKIASVERRIARASSELEDAEGSDATRLSTEIGKLEELRSELQAFREELLRVAELPYRPNLDDGVEINAAPLWRLFPHRQWHKRMKKTWKRQEDGEYDWAHMALLLWPERVREECRQDESLAIAHGLEELYEGES